MSSIDNTGPIKVHLNEWPGNATILIAVAMLFLDHYRIDDGLIAVGIGIALISGIILRVALYVRLDKEDIAVYERISFFPSRHYSLNSIESVKIEENVLILVVGGERIKTKINKKYADKEEWELLQDRLLSLGLLK